MEGKKKKKNVREEDREKEKKECRGRKERKKSDKQKNARVDSGKNLQGCIEIKKAREEHESVLVDFFLRALLGFFS